MNKVLKYTTLAAVTLVAVSCSFLDENMNTHYTQKDMYGTRESLETCITGCYSDFATSGFYNGSMMEWLSPASALVHWGLSGSTLIDPQKRWLDLLSLNQFSKNPYNLLMYKNLYSSIYSCNKLLDGLKSSPVDDAFKAEIEAEARYLRAQAYFHIVRRWGNAPIHLDVPVSVNQTNGRREPFWKIYGVILEDLAFAYENGRSYENVLSAGGWGTGRICKHAARALESLVYLTIGTMLEHSDPDDNAWVCPNEDVFNGFMSIGISSAQDAFMKSLQAAKDIMPETSTVGSPYRLAENYAQLFSWSSPEDYMLRERIFVITSTSEKANSQLATWTLPNYYNKTQNNMFYGRFRPSRFLFQKWCETYHGEKGIGQAANIYVDCDDPRLKISLIYGSFIGQDGNNRNCYPSSTCILNNTRWESMPYFKKYYDPKYDATAGYADMYVMRLAEVYLIAAEACANLCASPSDAYAAEGLEYVNVLMRRARNSTETMVSASQPADWNASDFATRDELIERIFWERAFEMAGEQHEYFDTHRMGASWLAEHVTIPANEFLFLPEQDNYNGGVTDGHRKMYYGTPGHGSNCIYPATKADVRRGLLCSFPNDELVYNSELTLSDQNPSELFWE